MRILIVVALASGCGGSSPGTSSPPAAGSGASDPAASYAPLDVGADHASWTKLSTQPFLSKTHGGRFVEVYANDVALEAFKTDDAAFPVGSIVVKTSWETKDGKQTQTAGPIFVMEKRPAGFDPDNEDWWFGLHWESVPPEWQKRMGGETQVYWRSPSAKAKYCGDCHQNYDRGIGGVPGEFQSWGK
jgi:hypothetical protein